MNKTRVAEYIDKHKLIAAIKASMVEINYITCESYNFRTDLHEISAVQRISVIDANKLLEALK